MFCGDLFDHVLIANYLELKLENISVAVMLCFGWGITIFIFMSMKYCFVGW